MHKLLLIIAICLVSSGMAGAQGGYPKPQVESAVGKPVPDFSLKDQNGATFTLSGQRGHWVLLYFYRGYW